MKYLMMIALSAAVMSVASCEAQAAEKATVLVDSKGVKLSLGAALKLSESGEPVYKCVEVKPSVSKSGTSISFKVVK